MMVGLEVYVDYQSTVPVEGLEAEWRLLEVH